MTIVFYRVDDPTGTPRANVPVYATLIGPTLTDTAVSERVTSTRSDAYGNWRMNLRANSRYAYRDSYYEIAVGNKEIFTVIVPDVLLPVPLRDIVGAKPSQPITVQVAEQNFTEAQEALVRGNLGIGSIATHGEEEYSLRSQSMYVVLQEGSGYPHPPTGYAVYRYVGTADPQSDPSLPLTPGSDWVDLNLVP